MSKSLGKQIYGYAPTGASLVTTGIGYNNNDWPFNKFTSNIDYTVTPPSIPKTYKKITTGSNASKLVILADTPNAPTWGNVIFANNKISYRHMERANVLFMDGHVDNSANLELDEANGVVDIVMQ